MVGKQKFSTRALPIHNWKVLSATLGRLELANIMNLGRAAWITGFSCKTDGKVFEKNKLKTKQKQLFVLFSRRVELVLEWM